MDYHIVQRVLGWGLLWLTLYRTLCKVFTKRQPEYNCRIITLIHATVITGTSCINTFFSGTNPFSVLGLPNTYPQIFIITISFGYFLYDFAWCLYHQTEGPVMLLHHVISISMMAICLFLGVSGTEVVATIFGSEITSIVLNVRWFLKEHELYSGTRLGFITDLLFVSLFLCVRMGVGGCLAYSVMLSSRSPLLVKIGGIAFYLVNCLFLVQILSFSRYRYIKWAEQQKQSNVKNSNAPNAWTIPKETVTESTLRLRKHGLKVHTESEALLNFEKSPFLSN